MTTEYLSREGRTADMFRFLSHYLDVMSGAVFCRRRRHLPRLRRWLTRAFRLTRSPSGLPSTRGACGCAHGNSR
jgi:hypothetical protein